jgi:hypothetical protein
MHTHYASAFALKMEQKLLFYKMESLRAKHSLKAAILYNMEELWSRNQADFYSGRGHHRVRQRKCARQTPFS